MNRHLKQCSLWNAQSHKKHHIPSFNASAMRRALAQMFLKILRVQFSRGYPLITLTKIRCPCSRNAPWNVRFLHGHSSAGCSVTGLGNGPCTFCRCRDRSHYETSVKLTGGNTTSRSKQKSASEKVRADTNGEYGEVG